MVHSFTQCGVHCVLDVPSGAVHIVDGAAYRLLRDAASFIPSSCPPEWDEEVWRELYALQTKGLLFSEEQAVPSGASTGLKALCLHVAHDCNLRCAYCFAGTGRFGGAASLMSPEVAFAALDMLVQQSGNRRNLEVDFFGGEPLMALDTVKQAVAYGRSLEDQYNKHFRFTLTTNGLLLDEDTMAWLNETMDNIVLSLDGRPHIHDALRKTTDGQGSYAHITPKLQALVKARTGDYYVRGTFTAKNPDFDRDVLHLAELGFRNLSLEPVVLPAGHPLAITETEPVLAAYDRLAEALKDRDDIHYFHFMVDLDQGPCLHKRLRGCGAGFEYAAVTPEGDLYPCHQFVGQAAYRMGSVQEGTMDEKIAHRFRSLTVNTQSVCASCWAKYYCSGGCAAGHLTTTGNLDVPDEVGCTLMRKRLECAIALQALKIMNYSRP